MGQSHFTSVYRITIESVMQKQQIGLTIIELMIAIAVLSIVLSVGVPSFERIMDTNQLAGQSNNFISSFNFARSEAVKRKQDIVICHSNDANDCAGSNGYEDGWHVYVDVNRNASFDSGTDTIIWTNDELSRNLTLRGNGAIQNEIIFRPNGRPTNNGSLTLCKENELTKSRVLVINRTGRVRVTALGPNGIAEDASGSEITSC